ncbi:MAG: ATP synthase F1 subunit delta [Bacteroidales bacterium]
MNTGAIASRYAKALLKYTEQTGGGRLVCDQSVTIGKSMAESPRLMQILEDPVRVEEKEKLTLLQSALGKDAMADELVRFVRLVIKHGRIEFLRLMLHSFTSQYYAANNITTAQLTTAGQVEGLDDKVKAFVKEKTGKDVILSSKMDPSIIGGFVFTIDDYRIDASISHQLEIIKRQFVEKNRRII